MKKFVKILSVALVALMLCTALVACMGGNKLNGTYVNEQTLYGTGVKTTLTFKGDQVTMKMETLVLGESESLTYEGTYEIVEEDGEQIIKIDWENDDAATMDGVIEIEKDYIKVDGIKYEKQ